MQINEIVAWAALGLAVALGIFCLTLNARLGRVEKQYRSLMRGSSALNKGDEQPSIGELLASQGERLEIARAELAALDKKTLEMDALLARSVQHVGLVRYNPFQDTGGDQSFALALLDKQGDGIVVSSLHTRTMTRFYAKPIKAGVSSLSLSEEEVSAVQQALGK